MERVAIALAFSLNAAACSFDGQVPNSSGDGAPGQTDANSTDALPAPDGGPVSLSASGQFARNDLQDNRSTLSLSLVLAFPLLRVDKCRRRSIA